MQLMAHAPEKLPGGTKQEGEEEEGDNRTFEELGLDPRLVRALLKKGIDKPTPIQQTAIHYILVSLAFLLL